MALDLQVVFAQESIRLNTIAMTSIAGVPALRIQGQDFRAVDEVVINDMRAPDVMILSQTELIAQLPESMLQDQEVRTVSVLSNRLTVSRRSLFRFRLGRRPGKVTGIMKLLQLFTKLLLTTPGSDIFSPAAGGGILQSIGQNFGPAEDANLATDLVIAVTRTSRQIVGMQSRDTRTPRDERLLSATVLGTQVDVEAGALYATIEIVSQAGTSATANLEL